MGRDSVDNWYHNYIRFLAALKTRVTKWRNRDKYRPALPPYIIDMLNEVHLIRNKYYRDRKNDGGVGEEETRILLRTKTRYVRNEISKYKSERWCEFLSKIQEVHDHRGNAFWSHLSKIYKPKTLPLTKLVKETEIVSDQQEIMSFLHSYHNDLAKAPQVDENDIHDAHITKEFAHINETLSTVVKGELEPTTFFEVQKIIRKLKNKKSSGYDQVSNHMIKLLSPVYVQCLVKCCNHWLKECHYPTCWKIAKIVTLNKLKAGVPRSDQTRPISLLPTHSKIFEKLILERVRKWAEDSQLVPTEQSGLRPGGLLPTRVLSI